MRITTLLLLLFPAGRGENCFGALLRACLIVAFVSVAPIASADGIAIRSAEHRARG
jgi:hypothetical protein